MFDSPGQQGMMPRVIKILLLINVGVFILDYFTQGRVFTEYLKVDPYLMLNRGQIWRMVTYMFVHSLAPPFVHLLFNMLMLWMFGTPLASIWSEKKFLYFYLACGAFSGLVSTLFYQFVGMSGGLVGASGAIFGLMIAFARYFPTQRFYLFFIFAVEARYAVLIVAGIELLLVASQDGIGHMTHLSGALFAYLYCRYEDSIDLWLSNLKKKPGIKKASQFQVAPKIKAEENEVDDSDIDPILKKISEKGIQSLNSREKKILEKASEAQRKRKNKIISLDDYRKQR